MFGEAAAFNQRLNFDTAKVMDVREYLCSIQYEKPDSDSLPTQTNIYQMQRMFSGASAFNQDLRHFDTAKVENVRLFVLSPT